MLALTYSLADQNFFTTKSVGIFNLSTQLLEALAVPSGDLDMTALLNSSLQHRVKLPGTVASRLHDEAIGGRIRRIWWDQSGVYRAAIDAEKDWLFLPKGFASFVRNCPVKLAAYVHDTILESYYGEHPGISLLERLYFRLCLGATLKQARIIFTNSDFTGREVNRAAARRGLKPPRVVTLGMGLDITPSPQSVRLNQIMVLASSLPHKRTDLALEFLARWQRETEYAGTLEWVGPMPRSLAIPALPNWRHHARLPQTEYDQLLSSSTVLVFFSDYEGFGMPPVEAILSGLCPVYSEIDATREVMAGFGCPFQNNSYPSFARALQSALSMPMAQLATWREQLLDRFNWPRVRQRLIETLSFL